MYKFTTTTIRFKEFMNFVRATPMQVGNPETNDYYDYKGLLEYAWSHAVISDQIYDKAKQVCDFTVSNWSSDCNDAMNLVFEKYNEIDIYNIYAPKCLINTTSSSVGSNDLLTKVIMPSPLNLKRKVPFHTLKKRVD